MQSYLSRRTPLRVFFLATKLQTALSRWKLDRSCCVRDSVDLRVAGPDTHIVNSRQKVKNLRSENLSNCSAQEDYDLKDGSASIFFFLGRQKLYCKGQKLAARPRPRPEVHVLQDHNHSGALTWRQCEASEHFSLLKSRRLKGGFNSKMTVEVLGGLTTLVLKDESMRKHNVAIYRMYSQCKGEYCWIVTLKYVTFML